MQPPIWKKNVNVSGFAERNRIAIADENRRLREEEQAQAVRAKSGIGTVRFDLGGGVFDERDAEELEDDPVYGGIATEALFKREVKNWRDQADSIDLELSDPSKPRKLTESQRAEILAEGAGLGEDNPRHAELKNALMTDEEITAKEKAKWEAKKRLQELGQMGVNGFRQQRVQSRLSEAAKASGAIAEQESVIAAREAEGVKGRDLQAHAQEKAQVMQQKQVVETQKQSAASAILEEQPKPMVDPSKALEKKLQDNKLFNSATTAMGGAMDKGIRRRPDGNWDLPTMTRIDGDKGMIGGMVEGLKGAAVGIGQKAGIRSGDEDVQKLFHEFQQENNLSDAEVEAAWGDLTNQYRKWDEGEKVRLGSNGKLSLNPMASELLDDKKLTELVANSGASDEGKAAALDEAMASRSAIIQDKLGAYTAAIETLRAPASQVAINAANPLAGAVNAYSDPVLTPDEWAKQQGRMKELGTPQFMLDYEANVINAQTPAAKFARGIATDWILGLNKLATTRLGNIAQITNSETVAQMAAAGSEGADVVGTGKADTGIVGSVVQEVPSLVEMVVVSRLGGGLFAQAPKAVATVGSNMLPVALAGSQSAGMEYSSQRAAGATHEEAEDRALKAGVNTAVITGVFQLAGLGAVEKFAAGKPIGEITLREVFAKASRDQLGKNVRAFAYNLAKSTAGEGAEEFADELTAAFLNAKPDESLADAWDNAVKAGITGAAIGGVVDVASNTGFGNREKINAAVVAAGGAEVSPEEERKLAEIAGGEVDPARGAQLVAAERELKSVLASDPESTPLVNAAMGALNIANGKSLIEIDAAELNALGIDANGNALEGVEPLVKMVNGKPVVLNSVVESLESMAPSARGLLMTEGEASQKFAKQKFTVTSKDGKTVEVEARNEQEASLEGAKQFKLGDPVDTVTPLAATGGAVSGKTPAPIAKTPAGAKPSQPVASPSVAPYSAEGVKKRTDAELQQKEQEFATILRQNVTDPEGRAVAELAQEGLDRVRGEIARRAKAKPKPKPSASPAAAVVDKIRAKSKGMAKLITVSADPAVRVVATEKGIFINPDALMAEATSNGLDDKQAAEWVGNVIDEEVRHMAQYRAAESLWKKSKSGMPYEAWRDAHYGAMWESEFVATGKAEIVRKLYGEDAFDALAPWQQAMEGIRMMWQQNASQSQTEVAKLWTRVTEKVLAELKAILEQLKALAKDDALSPQMKRELALLQKKLKEIESVDVNKKPSGAKQAASPSSNAPQPFTVGQRIEGTVIPDDGTYGGQKVSGSIMQITPSGLLLVKPDNLPIAAVRVLPSDAKAVVVNKTPVGERQTDLTRTGETQTPKEWEMFASETGTLGIPRAEMPQIKAENRSAMVQFLKARGIDYNEETVPADTLTPSQAEYSPAKVQKARDYEGGNRAILVSEDNYVVDGHHQWLAADGGEIRVIRLMAPIRRVLEAVKEMPSVEVPAESAVPPPTTNPPQVSSSPVVEDSGTPASRKVAELVSENKPVPIALAEQAGSAIPQSYKKQGKFYVHAPQKAKRVRRKASALPRHLELFLDSPVILALYNMGGVMSKSKALKVKGKEYMERNKSLWDGVPTMKNPAYNKFWAQSDNGEMPDQAAQTLYNDGVISEPSPDAMREAIAQAAASARNTATAEREEDVKMSQAEDFATVKDQGPIAIDLDYLSKGDKLVIDGEKIVVDSIRRDKDGNVLSVTVQDGTRFGRQVVPGTDEEIFVEQFSDERPDMTAEEMAEADAAEEARMNAEAPPTAKLPPSKMDIVQTNAAQLFGDDGGFALGQETTQDGDKIAKAKADADAAKEAADKAQGKLFDEAPKLTAEEEQAKKDVFDAFDGLIDGLEAAPLTPNYRATPPADRLPAFQKAAQSLIDAGVNSPEFLAAFLGKIAGDKLRPYSEFLWRQVDSFMMTDGAKPDWSAIYEPSPVDKKQSEEQRELEMVLASREIAQGEGTEQEKYNRLVELYESMPALNTKTSTSKINQAFSTPVPLSYAAAIISGPVTGSVYDSAAGHASLLIDVGGDSNVIVNELDPKRFERLRQISPRWTVTNEDATTQVIPNKVDQVRINPPFGSITLDDGSKKVFKTPMGDTTQIDHAIVLQTLENMKSDGRAVLIIGGPPPIAQSAQGRRDFYSKGNPAKFFAYLHENYNVIDHATVNGDLYKKQGAGWPVDVIVIDGKKKSSTALPSAKDPVMLNTWAEVFQHSQLDDNARITNRTITEEEMRAGLRDAASELEQVRGLGDSARNDGPPPIPNGRPNGDGKPSDGVRGRSDAPAQPENQLQGEDQNLSQPGNVGAGESSVDVGQPRSGNQPVTRNDGKSASVTKFQTEYTPFSSDVTLGTLVPTNMADAVNQAFARIKADVGDLKSFVLNRLGYKLGENIDKHFAGEQIDALAAAIWNFEKGGALIVGDQTGIGKGRIAAGLMRYAVNQGLIPVFVTEKRGLLDTMLRGDLVDIDAQNIVKPACCLSSLDEFDEGKRQKLPNGKNYFEQLAATGKLGDGANAIFTLYSQIQSDTSKNADKKARDKAKRDGNAPDGSWRTAALQRIAPNAVFILDESHNAAGASITGYRMADIMRNSTRVYYSSATSVKRPENMGIYFKTNIGKVTNGSMEKLTEIMQAGGVPAMQLGSYMLAMDGQYLRRERSFEGISFDTKINVESKDRDNALADNLTYALRQIVTVQEQMQQVAEIINGRIAGIAKSSKIPAGNRDKLETANFSSKVHNVVSQYLLAIKCNAAIEESMKAIRNGKKVVVGLANTMESAITDLRQFTADPDTEFTMTYKGLVMRYLDKMRTIKTGKDQEDIVVTGTPNPKYSNAKTDQLFMMATTREGTGEEGSVSINPEVVAEITRRYMWDAYERARDEVRKVELGDMPLSPIDYMRQAIEERGVRTGEITGRSYGIDTNGEIYERSKEQSDPVKNRDAFNDEDLDFLVINQSGSTGINLHAGEKMKNKKPRTMIVVQPPLDINTFMQMLGRIHRSGQVSLPEFVLLQTALPAEFRPAAILAVKMAMLNANTTSNAKSDVSEGNTVTDMFNKYGDQIAYAALERDPDLQRQLAPFGSIFKKIIDGDKMLSYQEAQEALAGAAPGYIARSITGYLAILPVEEQQMFWDKITTDYNALLDYLNEMGQNDLESKALELKAKTIEKQVFTGGTSGDSVFEEPSFVETVETAIGKQPISGTRAVEIVKESKKTGNEMSEKYYREATQKIEERIQQAKAKAVKWNPEKEQKMRGDMIESRNVIANALRQLGAMGTVKREDGSTGLAVIESVKMDAEKPFAAGSQIFTLQVNDGRRTMKISAAKIKDAFESQFPSASEWDNTTFVGSTRNIVTGNLLAAIDKLKGTGQIISYTTDADETKMGVLLPAGYTKRVEAEKARTRNLKTMEDFAKAFADEARVTTVDKAVKLIPVEGGVEIRVPASRSAGGKYWTKPALNALMNKGEFLQISNDMRATFPMDRLQQVIDLIGEPFVAVEKVASQDDDMDSALQAAPLSSGQDEGESVESPRNVLTTEFRPRPISELRMWELAALRAARTENGNRGRIASVSPRELSASGAESNNSGRQYLKSFATLFHKRVAFVLGLDSDLNFDGFLSDGDSNTIVINAESRAGMSYLLGHELGHAISNQQPALYDKLKEHILAMAPDWSEYKDMLRSTGAYETDTQFDNEFVNDFIGSEILNPKFLMELRKRDKKTFIGFIKESLNYLRSIGGKINIIHRDSRPYLTDLDSARKMLADTLEAYLREGDFPDGTKRKKLPDSPTNALSVGLAAAPLAPAPFYSQLARVIDEKLPKVANAGQVMQIAMQNAKAEEVKWSGLQQALVSMQDEKGKVTKEAVLEYLANEGMVRFEEVTMRSKESIAKEIESLGYEIVDGYLVDPETGDFIEDPEDAPENVRKLAEQYDSASDTKYSQYVLPGGENYREVVLAMPSKTPKFTAEPIREEDGQTQFQILADGRPYGTEWGATAQEAINAMIGQSASQTVSPADEYRSSHFPDVPNYVAHMRTNERNDASGAPGLFIEELQSDRHQAGRKEGYAVEQHDFTIKDNPSRGTFDVLDYNGNVLDSYQSREEAQRVVDRSKKMTSGVPDAPFRTTWPLALFKRALRDAVAGGKDWIGWTTGETQNERFDLSKQVDSVNYDPFNKRLIAVKDGNRVIDESGVSKEKLVDYVGKDVADRLIQPETLNGAGNHVLSGDGLKVGGSGMKGFYDNMLPKEIGKYVKQWGAKVEKSGLYDSRIAGEMNGWNIQGLGERAYTYMKASGGDIDAAIERALSSPQSDIRDKAITQLREAKAKGKEPPSTPIWRVDITDAMRKGVSSGQALFAAPLMNEDRIKEIKAQQDEFGNAVKPPNRASVGDETTRKAVDVFDIEYEERREKETRQQWVDRGTDLAKNRRKELIENAKANAYGEVGAVPLRPEDIVGTQIVIEQMVKEANGSYDKLIEAGTVIQAYRTMRSNVARVLASGWDRTMKPEERNRRFLANAILTLPPKVAAAVARKHLTPEQAKAEMRKELQDRLTNIDKALKEYGVTVNEVLSKQFNVVPNKKNIIKDLLADKTKDEALAIRMHRENADAAKIAKACHMTVDEVQKLVKRVYDEAMARMIEKARAGMTLETSGLQAASLLTEEQIIAEARRMVEIGLGISPTVHTPSTRALARKAKIKVESAPEKINWARPEFYSGLNDWEFNDKDLAEIKRTTQALIDATAATAKVESLTGEKRRQADAMLAKLESILAKYDTSVQQVVESGKPLESYRFDITDRVHVHLIANAIRSVDADAIDKGVEWYYFSMLSGLQTMMVNASSVVHGMFDATIGRGAEMILNAFLRNPMNASLGETKYILKAMGPMMSRARSNFAASYGAEAPFFEQDILGVPPDLESVLEGHGMYHRTAISGKKGQFIRIPTRVLLATDEFVKTINAMTEVGAMAYRICRAGDLKPGTTAFDDKMKELVNVPGSLAWQMAASKAYNRTFTNALPGQKDPATGKTRETRTVGEVFGNIVGKTQSLLQSGPSDTMTAKLGKTLLRLMFFPFVKVPYNITALAMTYTPLSLIDISTLYAQSRGIKGKAEKQKAQAEVIERMSRVMLGGIIAGLMLGAGEGDDDDLDKPILITGSRPYKDTKKGVRELGQRMGVDAYSISWKLPNGKRGVFHYGRVEPIATVLATTIDTLRELKQSSRGRQDYGEAATAAVSSFTNQLSDKTFLKGLGDAYKTVMGEQNMSKFVADKLAMAVPNLIKQPIRETDPYFRDKADNFGEELLSAIYPSGIREAKVDIYGEKSTKLGTSLTRIFDFSDAGSVTVRKVDEMLWRYQQMNPDASGIPTIASDKYTPVTGQGQKEMTEKQARMYRERAGQNLTNMLKTRTFNYTNPTDQDIKSLNKLIDVARDAAKTALKYDPNWK